ncbi:spore coat U domain-containing protein [Phenylobacterium sp.]|jgi:spore coat protein U-like protein|uniref:Csu type fimbrial protein n=1 Tax=Phenylobacterium sp. TaxID=1871053 RepID=UPI002F42DE30
MMHPSRARVLLAGMGLGASIFSFSLARAATTTATFTVTASVQTACAVSANNLNFGAYAGQQIDNTVTLLATCSVTVPYDIGLNQGTFTGATVTTRRMAGTDPAGLGYSLFQDTGRTTNWGNTVPTDTVHGVGTGFAQTVTVFGRIPGGQNVSPGSYSDTITVTLNF